MSLSKASCILLYNRRRRYFDTNRGKLFEISLTLQLVTSIIIIIIYVSRLSQVYDTSAIFENFSTLSHYKVYNSDHVYDLITILSAGWIHLIANNVSQTSTPSTRQ